MKTLRQTISDITYNHLMNNGGLLASQNVLAAGMIGGTVPETPNGKGIIELPTSDVSNGGVCVGMALGGKRIQYVIRYQGFITYNGSSIFNYAAKSKEMWNTPCPIFVRAIGMEGSIGPVASNSHHSVAMRFPGIKVYAPMCPEEWISCWQDFMQGDDPVYCSEHRKSYDWAERELWRESNSKTTILGIAGGRLTGLEAARRLDCNYVSAFRLKPFSVPISINRVLAKSDRVIIVDSDYTICGASEHIATILSNQFSAKFIPMGLNDKSAGFSPLCDNLTPSADDIVNFVNYLDS